MALEAHYTTKSMLPPVDVQNHAVALARFDHWTGAAM